MEFVFEKETLNTYRFREVSDTPDIGVLYVRKRAFGGKQPKKLIVEMKVVE